MGLAFPRPSCASRRKCASVPRLDFASRRSMSVVRSPRVVSTERAIEAFIRLVSPLDLLLYAGPEWVRGSAPGGFISHAEVAINQDWYAPGLRYTTMYSWGGDERITSLRDHLLAAFINPSANVGLCKLQSNPIHRQPGESPADYADRAVALRERIMECAGPPSRGRIVCTSIIGDECPCLTEWIPRSKFVVALYAYIGTLRNGDCLCEVPPVWLKKQTAGCEACADILS